LVEAENPAVSLAVFARVFALFTFIQALLYVARLSQKHSQKHQYFQKYIITYSGGRR
jgi:hypothetical protein